MNKKILNYINKCEGWKVAIKSLHWDARNMSQHELCDDIADEISSFEDLVSEVEQSMSGKLRINSLSPITYKIDSLKSFVEDVISDSQSFLKELDGMGKKYIGIKSECESFIGVMQRKLYLVNFTLKEELKNRLRAKLISESMPKNLAKHDEVDKLMGRRPKTMKARINQVYRIVKRYGIDSKVYHDDHWQAISDYYRAISSLGCEIEMKPCGHIENIDSMGSDGGYCDYGDDGMPRSKQYAVKIMYDDGMNIDGYIKCMACGTMEDPFSRYDTCIVLWPKNNRMLESRDFDGLELTEGELKEVIRDATMSLIREYNNKMAKVSKFVRSSHGHGNRTKKEATPEERAEARRRLGIKEPSTSDKVSEGTIKIKKSKEGTFTAAATKHGKTPKEFAKQVLSNKDDYSPKMVKKAVFADNFGGKKKK